MKKFTSGLLIGVILTTSIGTYAATNGRMIEVFDQVKRVIVNKVEKPFEKKSAPFIHNGSAYVPLKLIADALGENVEWDSQSGTIYIGETENKNVSHWHSDIKHMSFQKTGKHPSGTGAIGATYKYSYNGKKSEFDNLGNEYTNYLVMGMNATSKEGYGTLEFPLSKKYKKFTAKVGATDNYIDANQALNLKIYVDHKEVFSTVVKSGDLLQEVSIDLTQASKIGFEISGASDAKGTHRYDLGIFDGEFIK